MSGRSQNPTRRSVLGMLAIIAVSCSWTSARSGETGIIIWRDVSCGCCAGWAEQLGILGRPITIIETSDMAAIKRELGVPEHLQSCHTALVDDFIIEGHVPVEAMTELIIKRPDVVGLSVPGMPSGSPGMDTRPAYHDVYDVIAFDSDAEATFMTFKGLNRLVRLES